MIKSHNEKKNNKEKMNPFILAYLYSYIIIILAFLLLSSFEDASFSSDTLFFAFSIPLVLPVIPFFMFVIDALYLIAIIFYGIFLYFLLKLPYKFDNHKTLLFTLIILFTHFVGIFCIAISIPQLVA